MVQTRLIPGLIGQRSLNIHREHHTELLNRTKVTKTAQNTLAGEDLHQSVSHKSVSRV